MVLLQYDVHTALTVDTVPTEEPVSLDEARAHLRYEDTDENDLIESLITAAREHVESYTRRTLVTTKWMLELDKFPTEIRLLKPPIAAVALTVKYYNTSGVQTTLVDGTDYQKDTTSEPGRIWVEPDMSWPDVEASRALPVEVIYSAGYGAASAVPAAIKQAMLLLIGHWFENREAVVTGTIATPLQMTVAALLGPYRIDLFY